MVRKERVQEDNGLSNVCYSCGFFLGPLICAWIAEEINWRGTTAFISIAGGVTLLVGVFTIR